MKHVRFRIIPDDGAFHPVDQLLADAPAIQRRAIHQLNPVGSESAVTLYELEGDISANQDLLGDIEAHPEMLDLEVKAVESTIYAYAKFRLNETVAHLGLIALNSEILFEYPLVYTRDGSLRIYAVSDVASIRGFEEDLPANLTFELESIGEHHPQGKRFWTQLTPRQQEIIQSAVEMGYYQSPRGATYQDIADELGIAAGTVGEHLQKIEKRILTQIVP